jgi:cell division transport system permease protein
MRRAGSRLIYFARTALRGLAGSPVTSVVAVATIGVSLVLVGAFALLLQNMEELLDRFGDDLHVTAFLEAGISEAQRRRLLEIVRTVEGVEQVRFVSEAEALERFRAGVGRSAAFLEGLDENPLPASLEITLVPQRRSAAGMRMVVESLTGLAGIDDLSSGQDWVEGYLRAVALVRGLGIGLGAILALATLLIVANTIRLAVFARRDELEILSLVGASRSFVSTPFLLEGILEGAIGGARASSSGSSWCWEVSRRASSPAPRRSGSWPAGRAWGCSARGRPWLVAGAREGAGGDRGARTAGRRGLGGPACRPRSVARCDPREPRPGGWLRAAGARPARDHRGPRSRGGPACPRRGAGAPRRPRGAARAR